MSYRKTLSKVATANTMQYGSCTSGAVAEPSAVGAAAASSAGFAASPGSGGRGAKSTGQNATATDGVCSACGVCHVTRVGIDTQCRVSAQSVKTELLLASIADMIVCAGQIRGLPQLYAALQDSAAPCHWEAHRQVCKGCLPLPAGIDVGRLPGGV